MTTTVGDVTATMTEYDVSSAEHVTDGATNSSEFLDSSISFMSRSGCLGFNFSTLLVHDDSNDPISTATLNLFSNIKASILIPLIVFIGLPTNMLSMLVFFKHGLKQRINLCLFCLSLVDLVFLAFVYVMYAEQMDFTSLTASSMRLGPTLTFITNNHLLGFYGFGWASMFVSAIISGERCFCVIWPLRSSTLLKTRTTAVVILVGVVLITGGRFAVTEKYRVICLYDVTSGQERYHLKASEYYFLHKQLVDVLSGVVYGLILPMSTFAIVGLATVVTAVKLKKVAQWRQESSSALSPREIALTRMLIFLSIQFVVLNLPNVMLRVATLFIPELNISGRFANLHYFMTGVVEVCAALNSSLNFLVYYFAGTKYRETVHGLCRKATTKKKAVYADTTVSSVSTVS